MKFNSFIESLRENGNSQFSDNELSTDVIYIDQISHPINNDRRGLFYKYAEANGTKTSATGMGDGSLPTW